MSNEKDEPLSSEGEASGWSDEIFERAQERVENPEEESDFPPEERVIPSMIWGYVKNDDEFYSAVENWFKETYPDEDFE